MDLVGDKRQAGLGQGPVGFDHARGPEIRDPDRPDLSGLDQAGHGFHLGRRRG